MLEIDRFQTLKIIDINPDDTSYIKKALEIYDQSLGKDYITSESFIKYTIDKEKYIVLGSVLNNQLVGVMLAYALDEEEAYEYEDELIKSKVTLPLSRYKVGLIKSVAVEEKYRHKGIGTQLTLDTMKRFENKGCELLFAVSWVSNSPDSSPKMFESLGFQNVLTVLNYWKEESIRENYLCPNCNKPPCECTAIFYSKPIIRAKK